jgi:hypothetical protein
MRFEKEPLLFRIVPWFIVICFVAVAAFWAFFAFVAVKATEEIGQQGLKTVIERLWCGANGCK